MVRLLLGIFRDLYVVLLIILAIEQIPGNDLLHDMTRKGVIAVTVCIVVAKLVQPLVGNSPGGPVRAPRRQKKTEGGKSALLEWASSEMQGWRPAMEDATCVVASLPAPLSSQALFAVFDGHGGSQVSLIASKEFPKVLVACATNLRKNEDGCSEADSPKAAEGKETTEGGATAKSPTAAAAAGEASKAGEASEPCTNGCKSGGDGNEEVRPSYLGKALHLAMLTMDSFLRRGGTGISTRVATNGPLGLMASQLEGSEKGNAFNLVGSTAILVLVDCGSSNGADHAVAGQRPRRLVVANCGDSRAVLCRGGNAVELSEDHKPELPAEEARICRAGGHVALAGPCHRVDGCGLNLSRALGDFHYKARSDLPPEQQKVIAVPEIRTLELGDEDEFLLLGCDGIFELNTSQKAVDIVRESLASGGSVEQAAEDLVDRSCSPNLMKSRGKGGDNCSAIVVRIRR